MKITVDIVAAPYRFTVLTPTFNRGYVLHRVYESLKRQTFRDFEWLIVDDGSTDDTRDIVKAWIDEAEFRIRYIWQKNQHKKVAFNNGVRNAHGELFLPLDSDDEIFPNTLEILNATWEGIPTSRRAEFSAVTGLCVDETGSIIGSKYPSDPFDSNSAESHFRYKISGEKFGFQRTEVLKRFPFPEDADGLVPEGVVWLQIARSGLLTRYINTPLRMYRNSADSISQEKNMFRHLKGRALLGQETLEHLRWFWYGPAAFIWVAIHHTRYRLHLARMFTPLPKQLPSNVYARILVFFTSPLGVGIFLRDLVRLRKISS